MTENTEVFPKQERLVLGFDAGCMTCSEMAHKVEDQVGEKIEVCSLHDPHVNHWRKQALGENAPWAPTLIEVDGGEVKAWTGLGLSIALSRRLGLIVSWRVLHALREVRSARNEAQRSLRSEAVGGLTRVQFLKGLGGAAVAASVLSGVAAVASPSAAAAKTADLSEEQRRVQRKFIELSQKTPVGETFTLVNENGNELTFKRNAQRTIEAVVAPSERATSTPGGKIVAARSVCTTAVIAGIYALGSAVIGAAALAGTSLIIAGYVVGPQVLGAISAALAGGASLQAIVNLYIC
ncbi:MAG: hypothetical protein WA990_08635 [Rubrobacteraceae bacterium]